MAELLKRHPEMISVQTMTAAYSGTLPVFTAQFKGFHHDKL